MLVDDLFRSPRKIVEKISNTVWTGKGIQSLSTPQPLTNNHLACLFFSLFNLIITDGWTNGWTNRQTDRCFAGKSLSKNGVSQLNRGFECKRSIIFSLSYTSFTTEATIVIKQTQKLLQHLGTRLWQICAPRQLSLF